MNQLADQTSPYLRQHKDNPVDWRIWSEATLAEAARRDRPILLSIGYAACHWCHVMAAESFSDPRIAQLMNTLFVPIKVDREERPDIDAIYQNALALLGQQGGWPLTMFLTPKAEPFWGGTYFPPGPRHGLPGFPDVLRAIAAAYHDEPEKVAKNAGALAAGLARLAAAQAPEAITNATIIATAAKLGQLIDPAEGGFRGAPKFPQAPTLALLWRAYKISGEAGFRDAVCLSLDRMSQGGIYDHLGGGYARYATDARWLVPHFEKMLYDNAQLIELLTLAWQETRKPLYAARVAESIGWLEREMATEGGAFGAALDADSEHVEGKFYVWSAEEIEAVLGAEAALFAQHYDVRPEGNWEGHTILNRSALPDLMDQGIEARLAAARAKLLQARAARVRPGWDNKVLADWNGLAIAALARAAQAFECPAWLLRAETVFGFVAGMMQPEPGRLLHSWCDGQSHPGTLDDYASMSRAALALYQATGRTAYLQAAESWVAHATAHFADTAQGGFFLTADDTPALITRPRSVQDHATPSGNGVMMEVLALLWHLTGQSGYAEAAARQMEAFSGEVSRNAYGVGSFLSGVDTLINARQIVIIKGQGIEALLRVVHETSLPAATLQVLSPGAALPAAHPAVGKTRRLDYGAGAGEAATAYVCRGQTCSLPVTEPAALAALLSP
jgi:uncharacterized protein YyaL (SSP411 family)